MATSASNTLPNTPKLRSFQVGLILADLGLFLFILWRNPVFGPRTTDAALETIIRMTGRADLGDQILLGPFVLLSGSALLVLAGACVCVASFLASPGRRELVWRMRSQIVLLGVLSSVALWIWFGTAT
jgi:hypothetical protein